MRISDIAYEVHKNSREHGFWEASTNISEKLMLIVTEIAEAMECYRNGEALEERVEDGKPEGFVVELADTIIRVLDLTEAYGLNIEGAIHNKMVYNKNRPYLHGKIV